MAEGTCSIFGRSSTGSHIFAEFESLEGLNAPIRASARIKYTSIGVCRRYIALGASTGGLYIFHRETLKYLQVLTNKEGAITKVSFAPDDNIVGFATSRGFVIAWQLNIDQRDQPERLVVSTAHRNVQVTCLQWDSASLRLFSGDNKGRITQTNTDARKASGFFKMPSELLLSVESPIVQLDFADEKVLVSSETKCVICDTKKKQSYAVGKKLRDGQFGCCFVQKPAAEFPTIYTGRPGSRIWEANIVGQVQATHLFKKLLAIPPLPVVGPNKHPVFLDEHMPQSINFPILLPMGSRFLLTWTDMGVFVFDPYAVSAVLWTADIQGIVDAGSYKGQLYCLQENGRLHRYFLLTIERCIAKLFGLSLWEQCAQLCIRFAPRVINARARCHIPLSLVKELNYRLLDGTKDLDLVDQVAELVERIQCASPGNSSTASSRRSSLESCESVRLESGIYVIRNRHDSEDSFDDVTALPGDIAMKSVTLKVPESSFGKFNMSQNRTDREESLSVFPSLDTKLESGFSMVVSSSDMRDVAMNEESLHTTLKHSLSHSIVDTTGVDSFIDDNIIEAESHIDGSASEIDVSTMQIDPLEALYQIPSTAGNIHNSTSVSLNSPIPSTNNASEYELSEIQLDQTETEHESDLEQNAPVNTLSENVLVYEHPLLNQPGHSMKDNVVSCFGPRTTPSPEETVGDNFQKPNWNLEDSVNQTMERQYDIPLFESSVDSDAISQDSIHLNNISSYARTDSVPYNKSTSVPFPTITSLTSIESQSSDTSRPHDESPTRSAPQLRRTRSVPLDVDQAEMDMEVFQRQLSSTAALTKQKRKRKRKSKIVQIDETPTRTVQLDPDQSLRQTVVAISKSTDFVLQVQHSPVRSKSSPSSSPTSSSFLKKQVSTPSPRHISTAINSSKVDDFKDRPRPHSWDNFDPLCQTTAGLIPVSQVVLADLASQKLNLPSIPDSLSAMKDSLSSTLTNAKSFLLNKMDSKDELHHSVSLPTFNLFFPEEDRMRVDRLQSLIQVGKEQQIHPAARRLVTATSQARSKLEDEAILYSPSESRKVLVEWVQHLHAAKQKLYSDYSKLPQGEKALIDMPDLPLISEQGQDATGIIENQMSVEGQESKLKEDSKSENSIIEIKTELEKDSISVDDAMIMTIAQTSFRTSLKTKNTEQIPMICSSPSKTPLKESALSILENLGLGSHTLQINFEDKQLKKQSNPAKDVETVQDDIIMESVQNVNHDQDVLECNMEELQNDTFVYDTGILVHGKYNVSSNKLPWSESDSKLAISNNTACKEPSKQTYCSTDPFQLPCEIHQEIGELTVMCFEMGVYGNLKKVSRNTEVHRDLLQEGQDDEVNSEIESPCQLGSPFHVANHLLSFNTNEQSENDSDTSQVFSEVCMETDVDKVAAEFIKEYFHFLDITKVREVLSVREDHRKLSFAAVINCLQEKYKDHTILKAIEKAGATVGIDHLKNGAQKSPGLDLCFAIRLYQQSCEAGIDYMIQTHPRIKPWEVLHIVSTANDQPRNDYLSFVSGILDATTTAKRDKLLAAICKGRTLRMQLLQFALSHNASVKDDLFCSCGTMPRPGSHLKVWSKQDLINKIIALDASTDLKQQMLQNCQQYGYWPGVMVLLQELDMRLTALQLALQLGDKDVLSLTQKEGYGIRPEGLDEWKTVLRNVAHLLPCLTRKHDTELHCINCKYVVWPRIPLSSNRPSNWSGEVQHTPEEPECDWPVADPFVSNSSPVWPTMKSDLPTSEGLSDWLPTITWESIGIQLVRSVGTQMAVQLLREVTVPEKALSRHFHRVCIISAILENGQRTVSHTMLERVDTYLWSKRPTTMVPSLYQLVKNETKKAASRRPGEPAKLEDQMELLGSFNLPEGEFHYLEEPDCHWGTHVNINSNCSVCGVVCHTALPMALHGTMIFPCGHAFHKLCIPEKVCLICFQRQVSKTK